MSVFRLNSLIRVTCAKHTASYLRSEIEALGFDIENATDTAIELKGTMEECMLLNLYLRTAYRVLFLLDEFTAPDPDELYKNLVTFPWEEYIPEDGYISISSFVENIHIRDTRFANLKTKDAIVDRLQEKTGKRPDAGPDNSSTVLYLYWKENDASIFIDTSGDTIAKHSYRQRTTAAPMQESLAAAIIMASKWDGQSTFVNPMCGSGTIAIEAALIATNKAPGMMRQNFGFMHIKGFDKEYWLEIRNDAAKKISRTLPFRIIATDNSYKSINNAIHNAKQARVEHLIDFHTCEFEETPLPQQNKGVIVLNPPYGERLGEQEELETLYGQIGDFFKQKGKGYTGYIFTGNLELAKKTRLKAKRRILFFNARIDCRLLEFELYEGTRVEKVEKKEEE